MSTLMSLFNNFLCRFKANWDTQLQLNTSTTEKAVRKNNPSTNSILPWLLVVCGMILMLIWPVIHTIALRNILLFIGGFTGLLYLIRERSNLYQKSALPLFFILLFLVWIVIHYFLFARNSGLEIAEIRGTWLRVLLGCFLGVGTGLFARHHRQAQEAIWAGILLFVIIFYLNYVWVSFTRSIWTIPYPSALGLYGTKVAVVFFGIVSLTASCGMISYQLIRAQKNSGRNLFASMIYIELIFLAFVFVGTKNGVVLSLVLIFSLLAVYLVKGIKSYKHIFIASIFISIICLMSYVHIRLTPEWKNLVPAIEDGLRINSIPNWQDPNTYGLPKLSDGSSAPVSAYLRTAFATEGLKLLFGNPLGYGLVEGSFKYLTQENLPIGSKFDVVGTHSGWLDFSLAFGIPGLLLVWTAMALAVYYCYKQQSLWSYCTRWILAGVFLAWMSAELSKGHFVEPLFYLVTLLSAGNLPLIEKKLIHAPMQK
jgi:hypothetical protein